MNQAVDMACLEPGDTILAMDCRTEVTDARRAVS